MGEAADEVRALRNPGEQTTGASRVSAEESSESSQEAAQIRSGIEQTRADLSQTIDALQEKLDPTRIAEQVKDQLKEKAAEAFDTAKHSVKEATIGRAEKIVSSVSEAVTDATGRAGTTVRDTSSTVVQFIRDNPIPFALLGVGVGMLALNKQKSAGPSYGLSDTGSNGPSRPQLTDRARDLAGRATNVVSSAASSVRDAAGSAADTTRQQFTDLSDQATQKARAASGQFKNTLQENPMALGLAALTAGAVVGLTLPSTRIESEYMGETRDRLVDQARSVAHDAVDKVQRVTEEAGRTLKDAAQKEGLMVNQEGTATA